MSSQSSANTKEYAGHCHCKKFSYTFPYAQFENGEQNALSCNCSICTAKGLLLLRIQEKDFKFTSGKLEELTRYTWNTGKYSHHFCPVCGTEVAVTHDDLVVVNLRTVEGVDLTKLKLQYFDGANLL